MIVGDYCHPAEQDDYLFGQDEDEMLSNMIKAIGLQQDQVFVTNCMKCSCVAGGQPTKKKVTECFPFLVREIAVVKPPVICSMGELASQALLGSDEKLVRLRGRFHKYRYFDTYPIHVMPTFHPRFLLAHQEMKRATWQDLQLIQKRFLA
jgi:DNA polymerase